MEFEQHEYEEVVISDEDESRSRRRPRTPRSSARSSVPSPPHPRLRRGQGEHSIAALRERPSSWRTGPRSGDIHILLVGDPGVAKCVTSDAKVLMGDCSEKNIKELVDHWLSVNEVRRWMTANTPTPTSRS